ncbi:MAG: Acetoin dehydrogenase subunit dihydrolipoyllysine-residue acetyltransferase, partial [Candidatus Saccharibacteria bacterium]|nr:Acetoin dehydrogenase subunit dihydrolipoyllysine-residue acetyltransferase [Candidatus Saccharibacteria bacterium]
ECQPLHYAHDFQVWFDNTYEALTGGFSKIDWVVAHSFGCTAVLRSKHAKIILLCPVPSPSKLYRQYAWIIMRLAPFWAFFYSWKIFVWMRGAALRKVRTSEARLRIRWAGFQSHATYTQIIYQARLVNIILDQTAYDDVSDQIKLVIVGLEDTTAKQRDSAELGTVFKHTTIEFLRGGHLLPIESPDRTARQIKRVL